MLAVPQLGPSSGLDKSAAVCESWGIVVTGTIMKKTYQKPTFDKRQKLSIVTAAPPLSQLQ